MHVNALIRATLALVLLAAAAPALGDDAPEALPPLPPGATERFVDEPVFQGRARLVEAGPADAPAVVLVHGIGAAGAADWYGAIPALAAHYHVIAFDLPGFGRSDHGNGSYTPLLYATFVKWVVDSETRRPIALVGHSLGGAVALRYAAIWPRDLRRLVIVDAAGILEKSALMKSQVQRKLAGDGLMTKAREMAGHLVEKVGRLPVALEQIWGTAWSRKVFLKSATARTAALALIDEDFSNLLWRIAAPTTLLWGADDAVAPRRTADVLAAMLPDARLSVIDGAGHEPMHDQPAAFNARLLAAIEGPLPPAARLPGATKSERVGACNDETDKTFTGAWARLELHGCTRARVVDASVGAIIAEDSDLTLERVTIDAVGTGLTVDHGEVTATAVRIHAATGIDVNDAHLDLAGVSIEATEAAIVARDASQAVFSACRVKSPHTTGGLHGLRRLTDGAPL